MARGSIIWRCPTCGDCYGQKCEHKGGRYFISFPVQTWDPVAGKVVQKRKWEKAGTLKKKAEEQLADKLKGVADGTYRDLQEITFAAFADKWLAEYAKAHTKRATFQGYESYLKTHLKPAFGPLALTAIRADTVQGYIAAKLAAGAKPKSVKNHLVMLKGLFRHAVKWGYLKTSPAGEVKAPRVEREEMDFLTPGEVAHLLTARVKTEGKPESEWPPAIRPGWYVPIKFAIFTGLRQGEQFALRIGDIDFHAGQVRVRRSLAWRWKKGDGEARYEFTSPKTKQAVRNVDLPPDLLQDLRRYVAGLSPYYVCEKCGKRAAVKGACCGAERVLRQPGPEDLLFASSLGTPLDPRNVVDRVFRPALAGAELRLIRWHDLRHTFASLRLAAGANVKRLSQQMGHASVQITLDRYSHLLKDSDPDGAARMEALVFGAHQTDVRRVSSDVALTSSAGHQGKTPENKGNSSDTPKTRQALQVSNIKG
jgi:integrase